MMDSKKTPSKEIQVKKKQPKPVRKPYTKPEVIYLGVLEALAAACNNGAGSKQTTLVCSIEVNQS